MVFRLLSGSRTRFVGEVRLGFLGNKDLLLLEDSNSMLDGKAVFEGDELVRFETRTLTLIRTA